MVDATTLPAPLAPLFSASVQPFVIDLLAKDPAALAGSLSVLVIGNAEATKALGRVLHRPTGFWAPGPALRITFGDFSTEILGSHRVLPRRRETAGFAFEHPDIESVLRAGLAG